MARILIGNIKGPKGNTGARGSQWFYGTGITGTSTTATVFSGSGVAAALVGDYYLSTAEGSLGNVYRCTVAGAASAAKWVYAGNIRGAQGIQGIQGETGPMPALINNALTTVAGQAALDAAMGKALQDEIDTLNSKIVFLTGTLPSELNGSVGLPYPNGCTRDNCAIISTQYFDGTYWRDNFVGSAVGITAFLGSGNVSVYVRSSSAFGMTCRVGLMIL